jgi:tRNA nucleotidyltransferase/poly(A) polymerase
LETALLRINDHEVDLSHMRTESYSDHSRIPTTEFGSPAEDSLRRDCTINALYYNLDSRRVEDPTGKGLHDLKNRVIRTANTDPLLTLHEDPLRLLRLVRFSSTLGFAVEKDLQKAFSDPLLLENLEKKVSRERILIEFDKMLALHSEGYQHALQLLASVEGLLEIVLWPGVNWQIQPEVPVEAVDSEKMLSNVRLASLMLPHLSELPRSLQRRLMWPNERRAAVEKMVVGSAQLKALMESGAAPSVLAMWARQVGETLWKAIFYLMRTQRDWPWSRLQPVYEQIAERENRVFLPPLIRGDELAREYGLKGPQINDALQRLIQWQMDAPELSREAAKRFLEKIQK